MSGRRILLATGANLIGRGAYLLLFLWIGNRYGASQGTDQVFFSYAVLSVLMSIMAGAAEVALVPGFVRAQHARCAGDLHRRLGRISVVLMLPLGFVLMLLLAAWDRAPALPALLLLALLPPLAAQAAIEAAFLHAQGRHLRALSSPFFGALPALAIVALAPIAQTSLALTFFAYECGRLLVMYRPVHAEPAPGRQADNAHRIIGELKPVAAVQALASGVLALVAPVDAWWANTLGHGFVTLNEYALRLWTVGPLLFAGYLSMHYRSLSQRVVDGTCTGDFVHGVTWRLLMAGAVVSGVAMLASAPLIDGVYGDGVLEGDRRDQLATAVIAYFLGLAPMAAGLGYVRALAALGRPVALLRVASCELLVKLLGNAGFVPAFGLAGIGYSTSLMYLLAFFLLLIEYRRADRSAR